MKSTSCLADGLARTALVLWLGGLWAIGYLAAPVLFAHLPRLQAGEIAGRLFALIGWIGLVAGAGLLFHAYRNFQAGSRRPQRLGLLGLMWVLAALQLFWFQPVIADIKAHLPPLGDDVATLGTEFARWHGISSAAYLLQSLAGLVLLLLGGVEREAGRRCSLADPRQKAEV
ncbi:MAG TPA: DUF4149 domain-containing protein [Azospira sp.]|nr:DUF4149 domain-containing protein [Azospira sp.]